MENNTQIAIVIVNYNSLANVKLLIEQLFRYKKSNYEYTIFVVNNEKTKLYTSQFLKNDKIISIINNYKNLGYSKAINRGIRLALSHNFRYILLINPDVRMNSDFVSPLIHLIKQHKNAGICAPILTNKNKLVTLDLEYSKLTGRVFHKFQNFEYKISPKAVNIVSGCCMLVKSEVFHKIGLFDERFFLYYEDCDFCLRVRKAGYQIFIQPKAQIYHLISQSIGSDSWNKIYHIQRSSFLFDMKHINPLFWPICIGYLVLLGGKMSLNKLLLKR